MSFPLFSDLSAAVAVAERPVPRSYYNLLRRMRRAVDDRSEGWSQSQVFAEYAQVCFWAIRKLEYGFATESLAAMEDMSGHSLDILDVGCGVVPLCNWISSRDHRVTAIDPDPTIINLLVEKNLNAFYGSTVRYDCAHAEHLPFANNSFDVVTCISVLEHTTPGFDRLALWEIARVLKPGGRLILTFDVSPGEPACEDEPPLPEEAQGMRQFGHAFSPGAARRLLTALHGTFDVSAADLPASIEALTWDAVHRFWRQGQAHDQRSQQERDYLAIGSVLTRSASEIPVDDATRYTAMLEGEAALRAQVTYFEYHATKREQVIEELVEDRVPAADTVTHLQADMAGLKDQMGGVQAALQEQSNALQEQGKALQQQSKQLKQATETLAKEGDILAQLVAEPFDQQYAKVMDDATARVTTQLEREYRAALDAAQAAAEARLTVIEEQKRALESVRGRDWSWQVKRFTSPRIGVLYQYDPRPLAIPRWYGSARPPVAAPLISIVTSSFNQGAFIERTLQSVLGQNYPCLEYVVQDGASTDGTAQVLERYEHRLSHLESRRDNGLAHGLNLGFHHATGEILAYLNSDDLLLPGALSYVSRYFAEHPDVDVVYGQRTIIDEYDGEIGRWVLPPHEDWVLSWADYVPQETLFWRRAVWERVGGAVDESFRFAVDWDLLVRFRQVGARMACLPRFLGAFRVHPHQKTSAEMSAVGATEMKRIRTGCLGREPFDAEIGRALVPYLRRHVVYHKLYRAGVLRY